MSMTYPDYAVRLVPDTCTKCGADIWVSRTDQHNYCRCCSPPRKRVRRAYVSSTPAAQLRDFNQQVYPPCTDRVILP
jgi:hypothetical protein